MGGVRGQWKLASLYNYRQGHQQGDPVCSLAAPSSNPTCEVEADNVVVTYLYNLQTSPAAECSLQYRVFGDGRIEPPCTMTRWKDTAMPEFVVLFKIDADYGTVRWYACSPAETYWDRGTRCQAGHYQNKGCR